MQKRKKEIPDTIFCCIVLSLLLLLVFNSRGLPAGSVRLPLLVCWITIVFVAVQICLNLFGLLRRETTKEALDTTESVDPLVHRKHMLKIICSVLFMALTLLLWYLLGFLAACIISSILFAFYLGERRIITVVLCCAGVSLAMYWLFGVLLHVPLPKGILFGGYWNL